MVGVLALAAVCRAVPEADPQFLLGSPLTTPYALPSLYPYNTANLYNPYYNFLPAPAPLVVPATAPAAKVITPLAAPAPLVAPATVATDAVIPPLRPYTPYDCVTPEGCAVKTLKEHGLAKRDAEADADPEAYYGFGGYSPFYGYNGLYGNGFYGGYPYANGAYPYGVNSLWNYAAHGLGYATGFEGYPASTAPLPALPAPVVAPRLELKAPIVAPAPVPAPLFARAPIAAPVFAPAPLPVVHKAVPLPAIRVSPPVVKPVVAEAVKPVTYTHLGAHPIQPTTVLEKTSAVVGHQLF